MIISALIENECSENRIGLQSEHGLSLYIEVDNKKILFDAGSTDLFSENAEKMGINLQDVDIAILSHAHNDHSGGMMKFLQMNKKAKIYMSQNASQKCYFKMGFLKKEVGVSKDLFASYAERIQYIDDVTEIAEGTYLVPNLNNHPYPMGDARKKLLVKKDGKLSVDPFEHEIMLVIKNNEKLVVVTGCSHNGITNMVEEAVSRFPGLTIQAVIGGFHLMGIPFKNRLGESKEFIQDLGKTMQKYDIEKIYTCHCTGQKAYAILKEMMPEKLQYLSTGQKINLAE